MVVRRLPDLGWDPIVLTSEEQQQMLPNRDHGLLELIPDSVEVVRSRVIEPYNNVFYRFLVGGRKRGPKKENEEGRAERKSSPVSSKKWKKRFGDFVESLMIPDRFMGWLPFAYRAGSAAIRKYQPDLILSVSPSPVTHILGRRLSKRYGIPWVQDFHDPWTRYSFALKRPFPLKQLERLYEEKVLSSARRIIVTAKSLIDEYVDMYPRVPREKYRLIHYGYSEDAYRDAEPVRFDKFTLVYTGTSYDVPVYRDLMQGLKEAMARRPEVRGNIQVLFIGHVFTGFDSFVASYGIEDFVKNLGHMDHESCTRYLMGADAAFYYIYYYNQISCKIFEYLRSGVDVLAILPNVHEARELLERHGRGTIARLGDPSSVADKFLELYSAYERGGSRENRVACSEVSLYEWGPLAERYACALDEAIDSKECQGVVFRSARGSELL